MIVLLRKRIMTSWANMNRVPLKKKEPSIIIKDVRYCTLPALQKKTSESNKEELPISASVAERKLDVIAKQLNLSSPVLVKGELILRPMKKFFARTRIIDSSLAF